MQWKRRQIYLSLASFQDENLKCLLQPSILLYLGEGISCLHCISFYWIFTFEHHILEIIAGILCILIEWILELGWIPFKRLVPVHKLSLVLLLLIDWLGLQWRFIDRWVVAAWFLAADGASWLQDALPLPLLQKCLWFSFLICLKSPGNGLGHILKLIEFLVNHW